MYVRNIQRATIREKGKREGGGRGGRERERERKGVACIYKGLFV